MLKEEIDELKAGKFQTIYFAGKIPERSKIDLAMLETIKKDKIQVFEMKKKEVKDKSNG